MSAVILLERAGWFGGRDVGERAAGVLALRRAGYAPSGPAVAVLREFSGLTVTGSDSACSVWIDGRRAAGDADPDWVRAYSKCLGRSLVPVGGYSHMTLLIDEEGRLWGGFDVEFGRLGDTVADVAQALLLEPGSVRLERRVPPD